MLIFNHRIKSQFNLLAKLVPTLRYTFGIFKFNLPDLGQKIKEGTIKKLYVKEGDIIEDYGKIADVASDKQFSELTAPVSGTVQKIYFQEEQVCQVGDLFLQIMVKDQAEIKTESTSDKKSQKLEEKTHQISKENSKISSQIFASPYVRGLIKKQGLDINNIQGTGQNGRILEKDLQKIINKPKKAIQAQPKPKIQVQKPKVEAQKAKDIPKETPKSTFQFIDGSSKQVTMNRFEQGMQKTMTQSNTIPHLYLHEEFDITEVQKMRKSLKESNKKVTVMGMLVKTFSLALKHYPIMNSLYRPEVNPYEYHINPNHNISIAIDSPNGLVVPHIRNVNELNLVDIQGELQRLRNLAKEGKLTGKQLQGGTICLSNIGTIGGTHACPLILPPQVCIVAIGKLQSVPKYKNGQLSERKVINISFGCDHRVLDGATVARFSNQWKQLIQNPYLSIAEMI